MNQDPPAASDWYYVDDDGRLQGPFPATHMRAWLANDFFTETTLVKRGEHGKLGPLGKNGARRFEPPASTKQQPQQQRQQDPSADHNGRASSDKDDDKHRSESNKRKLKSKKSSKKSSDGKASKSEKKSKSKGESKRKKHKAESKGKRRRYPTDSAATELWAYIDDNGVERGSFSGLSMFEWCELGYFDENTLVRRVNHTTPADFSPIGQRLSDLFCDEPPAKSISPSSGGDKSVEPGARNGDGESTKRRKLSHSNDRGRNANSEGQKGGGRDGGGDGEEDDEDGDEDGDEDLQFFYIDDDGQRQGPYESRRMVSWVQHGYFGAHTLVKRAGSDEDFAPIGPAGARRFSPSFVQEGGTSSFPTTATTPNDASMSSAPAVAATVASNSSSETPVWFYIDNSDVQQGPFEEEQMAAWIRGGFFPRGSTKVSHSASGPWIPIRDSALSQYRQAMRPEMDVPDNTSSSLGQQQQQQQHHHHLYHHHKRDRDQWWYLDDQRCEQGPWTTQDIASWYNSGMIKGTVPLRRGDERKFTPVKDRDMSDVLAVVEMSRTDSLSPEPPTNASIPPVNDSVASAPNQEVTGGAGDVWFYIDKHGREQGPWEEESMRVWFDKGYLTGDILVRRESEARYLAIGARDDCSFASRSLADDAIEEAASKYVSSPSALRAMPEVSASPNPPVSANEGQYFSF